jgi:hypothetical protein
VSETFRRARKPNLERGNQFAQSGAIFPPCPGEDGMSTKILSILMTVTLGFVSVSSRAAPEPSSLKPPDQQAKTSLSQEQVRELAYSQKRRIGLRRHGIDRCPKAEGWTSESLLDLTLRKTKENKGEERDERTYFKKQNASPVRQIEISTEDLRRLHKLGLDRYCIYTALPGTEDFRQPSGLVKAERDRMALSTTSAGGDLSDALGTKIWQTLAEQFRKQTGQEASAPGSAAPKLKKRESTDQPLVRLAFVDSQPDGEWILPTPATKDSQHGFTLGHLAYGLVCPSSGPCAATIVTRRALCYQKFDPEQLLALQEVGNTRSGHMGLVSDLAAAILAEVLHWRDVGTPRHLILNLSLGWDGELFGDLDAQSVSQLEPSVQAVYKALRFARQSGVLVVAAAGNAQGRESAWPLFPAAWELRRPTLFHLPFGRKRIYAVGGVDSQGLPLPNTRKGGQPRRVAYADHAVTGAEPSKPTAMYTGTSVSAAVVSSIAAVVWHLQPELTPAEVMRLITRSGDELDTQADFYAWKWLLSKLMAAPNARRLSLCQAVQQACEPNGKRCPDLEPLSKCPAWAPKPAELAEILATLGEVPVVGQLSISAERIFEGASADITSQRWVTPQPEETPCPGCTLVPKPPPVAMAFPMEPQYDLLLEITQSWHDAALKEGVDIAGATLVIDCPAERDVKSSLGLDLRLSAWEPKKVHRIESLARGSSLEDCKAYIDFELTGSKSVMNPVVIDSRTFASR